MTSDAQPLGPLAGLRVIDLATERAEIAGRVLADLGAEVIKVEPPEGAPSRRLAPFRKGREGDPEGSLYWAAYGLGKHSIVIDIQTEAGRDELRRLLRGADIFVESFDPGRLEAIGLGYDAVRALNPALVYVSVTPYGQTGPDALSPASDLTLQAAGGLVSLQGDRDRPPLPIGYPQAELHAGLQAAADAVIALNERATSGLGQHLDVSMQAAMVWTLMNATGYPKNTGADMPGFGDERGQPLPQIVPGVDLPVIWECADGYVTFSLGVGRVGALSFHKAIRWLEQDGGLAPHLGSVDWTMWPADVMEGRLPSATVVEALDAIVAFIRSKTKQELMAWALREDLLLAPILTPADLTVDPQLAARDYWATVDGTLHPGIFARFSRTPVRLGAPAPKLGDGQRLLADERTPAAPEATLRPRGRPFDGLKVADFAWVGVGPIITKALADHGATVVHVESMTRPDVLREAPPFKDNVPGLDRAQFMANFNSSKLGLALNLGTSEARVVAQRLIDWADVVVESFTPGTMQKLGFDYATISRGRPDLIMLSTCLRGQTGPERTYGGFGGQGAALAGVHGLTGWPDRAPRGPWGAYTDFIAPRYGVTALASAILERRRSGLGQYIDMSQIEAAIHFIEPLVLDYTANGRNAGPAGLRSERASPNGVYATAGTERYIAIAVETAEQWRALRSVAPLAAFDAPELDDIANRRVHEQAIDAALAGWCRDQDRWTLAAHLKRSGVPAAVVERPSDLYDDPQLRHRGFFVTCDHTVMGPTPYDGPVTLFSETPAQLRAAPCLGEHTEYVLGELLGLESGDIVECAAAGALS